MGYLLQNGGLGMAGDWIITGGRPLQGRVEVPAAKNSVLPLLAATLLCAQPCTLRRVPLLRDVQTSLDLLRAVGSGAAWAGQDLVTQPARQISGRVPTALAGAMRGSVFYLAPLLTRAGWAELPLPGGCRLGPRPIDIHLAGLTAMGAQVCAAAECVALRRHGVLRGTDFALRLPSVGATLTLMLAACCAAGVTTLRGAACEPEIADTAAFLNACGAKITGAGTPVVCIRGTGGELLDGCVHTVLPDRIAAATYAAGGAPPGGGGGTGRRSAVRCGWRRFWTFCRAAAARLPAGKMSLASRGIRIQSCAAVRNL